MNAQATRTKIWTYKFLTFIEDNRLRNNEWIRIGDEKSLRFLVSPLAFHLLIDADFDRDRELILANMKNVAARFPSLETSDPLPAPEPTLASSDQFLDT